MKLSVIIVSFNTRELILECLKSVYQTAGDLPLEVIVVDNASADGSPAAIKKHFPRAKLISNAANFGFAKANNQGIKTAKGEHILLLNSDTEVKPQALTRLVEFMDGHPQVGIVAPQLLNSDGSVQPNGGFLPRLSNVMAWMLFIDDLPWIKPWFWSYQLRGQNQFKRIRRLGWVQGAAIMFRATMLKRIGPLDPNIFMYAEDVEICFRAKGAGWPVMLFPAAQVIHRGFRSGSSAQAVLGEYQGLTYIFRKHKPAWERPILRTLLQTGALLRMILFGTILRDTHKYATYKQAFNLA